MNDEKMSEAVNPELQLARRLVEHTGANIFLTGKAGTGKTTFLRNLCAQSFKRIVVAAPTGIAAINAQGSTLHSLLQLDMGLHLPGVKHDMQRFSKRKLSLLRSMDMLVIDEISMVRADLLDYVDEVLRRWRNPHRPFGGVQLLLIGDLQQLPPVVRDDEWALMRNHYASPYFFHSHALMQAGYITLELTKVYRQDDEQFLSLLNDIRSARNLPRALAALNERYIPGFVPDDSHPWIRLTTHNASAAAINQQQLGRINSPEFTYQCRIEGNFPQSAYPADELLKLKLGAQVMFIKNDTEAHRYFNGMIGTVTAIDKDKVTVTVPDEEMPIEVTEVMWENMRYDVDPRTQEMTKTTEGAFFQLPLRTAWAITIHKSQGLTFSHACIDAAQAFAHGQTYVALSRCRNLQGLVLTSPLNERSVITDSVVNNFMENGRQNRPDSSTINRLEREYVAQQLDELFMLEGLERRFSDFQRIAEEAFRSLMPLLMDRYTAAATEMRELRKVGLNFSAQYRRLLESEGVGLAESKIQERLKAAATYYLDKLRPIRELLARTPSDHDNQALKKRLAQQREPYDAAMTLTLTMLEYLSKNSFDMSEYLNYRAKAIVRIENPAAKTRAGKSDMKSTKTQESKTPVLSGDDVKNPELFAKLRRWRMAKAKELELPAYQVLSTKALMSVSERMPITHLDLIECKGIGEVLASRFGDEVIRIVAKFIRESKK